MSDQPGAGVPIATAQAWDSVRGVREPVAWALVLLAGVMVLVSAGQLFGVPGVGLPICGGPPTGPSCFAQRALEVTPQLFDWIVLAPPVLSIVLVAFCGGPAKHARQVLSSAAAVQACTLVLGAVGLAGGTGTYQPASSYVFDAAGLAITATGLIFTAVVIASPALRSVAPRLQGVRDDEGV